MIKRTRRFSLFSLAFLLMVATQSVAQILHPANGGMEMVVVPCDGMDTYTDEGGAAGNYMSANESSIMICADAANYAIEVTFTAFELEASTFSACFDNLTITGDVNGNDGTYGGDDNDAGAGLVCMDATDINGDVMLPTFVGAPGACLTFAFDSDGSVTDPGWEANVVGAPLTGSCAPDTSGGAGIECILICSGDQTYTLDGGQCSVQLPNLVSFAGPCEPAVVGNLVEGFVDEFDFSSYAIATLADLQNNTLPTAPWVWNGNDCDDWSGIPSTVVLQDGGNCNGFAYSIYEFTMPNFDGTFSFDYDVTSIGFGNAGLFFQLDPVSQTLPNIFLNPIATTVGTGTYTEDFSAGDTFVLISGNQTLGGVGSTEIILTNIQFDGGFMITPYTINQTSGPSAGDQLSPGDYDLMYELLDPEGNVVDDCDFTVTVEPFDNPSSSLSCNSRVNISVDNLCDVTFNADQFLEGDNYGCYDSLQIFILPYGNQSAKTPDWNGTTQDFSSLLADANRPHEFEIMDPATGNKCWGTFIVEDKIAPAVDCPCSEDDQGVVTNQFSGFMDASLPQYARPNGFAQGAACFTAGLLQDHIFEVIPFTVDVMDTYTFNTSFYAGDGYAAIYDGPINIADGCENAVTANDDGAGGLDPLLTATLTPGVTYFYVFTVFASNNTGDGDWITDITSLNGGQVLFPNTACEFECYELDAVLNSTLLTPNPDLSNGDNCGSVDGTFTDVVNEDDCGTSEIRRTWSFTDESGNTSTCTQIFTFENIGVGDLSLPPAVVELGCNSGVEPFDIALALGVEFAYPHYFIDGDAFPVDNKVCNLIASYTDRTFDACDFGCHGNQKVIRDWVILDWCEGTTTPYQQIIKATDTIAPTFIVSDTVVSTRPWDCTAQFDAPLPWELHDNCDLDPTYSVAGPAGVTIVPNDRGGYTVSGAPKGFHDFVYTAEDCCGNVGRDTITIEVRDVVAPVVSTKQDIVVALTPGGPGFVSSSKVTIPMIDNFSYDACTDVFIELRRPEGAPDCDNLGLPNNRGELWNNNVTFSNASPRGYTFEPDVYNNLDTDGGQFVKVCCEDVTSATVDVNGDGVLDTGYVEVIIRVWDDANMNGVFGDVVNGQTDNFNEAWSYVKVEDNLPAIITCPEDITIECYWQIDLSTDFGRGFISVDSADFSKTGIATAYSTCDIENISFQDRPTLDDCGLGSITRTFQVSKTDKSGGSVSSTCQQLITVNDQYQSTFVVTPPVGSPFPYDACTFDPSTIRENQKPSVTGGICDVIGESVEIDTFLFEDGVCKKWRVEYVYNNWCTGETSAPIFVDYMYTDSEDPVVECQDTCYSVDANCEYTLALTKSATDAGGCTTNGWLKWYVTVDTWADGTVDYAGSSFVSYRNWTADAALSAQFGLPATTLWIEIPATGNGQDFNEIEIPEDLGGKYSRHKVTYKVTDGCHNFSSCEEIIEIADKKAPTPYCVSLSSALMQDPDGAGPAVPMVELWACDFNVGSFDNCSEQDELFYTFDEVPFVVNQLITHRGVTLIVNETVPHYFDMDGNFVDWDGDDIVLPAPTDATERRYMNGELQRWFPGTKCSGMVFNEASAGYPQVTVRMTVWDKRFNSDFCDIFLTLQLNGADGQQRTIAGNIATAAGQGVEGVEVSVESPNIEKETVMTTATGSYAVSYDNVDATVEAKRDGDDDNGISTLDLVLIQRHIIGRAQFSSPYNTFAADVNNSGTVSGADVVELRQLILGVTSEFANTDSWRFLDESQSVDNDNVFGAREFAFSTVSASTADLVAVKMGDVNGSADALDIRSGRVLSLDVTEESVNAGDVVELTLSASDYVDAYGYQFTIDLNGLELVDASAADLAGSFDYAVDGDKVSVSYASTTAESATDVIRLVVKATSAGSTADMLAITSDVTRAEAYMGAGFDIVDVELASRDAAAYELFQNEPNPFKELTSVSWTMAEAGAATITVYDVAGRVIKRVSTDAVAGLNTLSFSRNDLNATGVLYYQLEAGEFTATKKMILID